MIKVHFEYEPSTIGEIIAKVATVDPIVSQTARAVGTASRAAYRGAAPSQRIKKAINSRQRTTGPVKIVQTGIKEIPMGAPVHGRDPGTQAIALWLNKGTADAGSGKIFRTTKGPDGTPAPFMFTGRPIPFVRGQRPQHWVDTARRAADSAAEALAVNMNERIDVALEQR